MEFGRLFHWIKIKNETVGLYALYCSSFAVEATTDGNRIWNADDEINAKKAATNWHVDIFGSGDRRDRLQYCGSHTCRQETMQSVSVPSAATSLSLCSTNHISARAPWQTQLRQTLTGSPIRCAQEQRCSTHATVTLGLAAGAPLVTILGQTELSTHRYLRFILPLSMP